MKAKELEKLFDDGKDISGYLDRSKTVVGCIEQATPLTAGPYTIGTPSKYVLETHALFYAEHGIAEGDTAAFINIPNAR